MPEIRRNVKTGIQQPGLLIAGVDVSKAKYDDCMRTKAGLIFRKLGFTNTCEGFSRNTLKKSKLK